jgi:hypothetical protein
VDDVQYAAYAIEFAERELGREPARAHVLIGGGLILLLAGFLGSLDWLFLSGGAPLGAGLGSLGVAKRLERARELNTARLNGERAVDGAMGT